MKKLRVAYFGTPQIAVPPLEKLATLDNIEIVFVGVFPDKPVGRKQIMTPCPVKQKALELGRSIKEISNKEDLVRSFQEDFDLAIVIAFGMIFPSELFDGTRDIINVHFSLLPKYRGASPVQSAILNNDKTSGITFQRMVHELDAGDILWQKEANIEGQKTSQIWEDFSHKTADELPAFLEAYQEKSIKEQSQITAQATFCGKFKKEDGLVNLQTDQSQEIYQKYLAFDVWPGIYTETKYGKLKLKELEYQSGHIEIIQAQLEGKKMMPFADITRGHPDLFGE